MLKVLVTGGAGYIGSVLVGKLLKKYQVTVLDNLMYDKTSLLQHVSNKNFTFIKGDVRDEELLKKLVQEHNIIIPLAALVGAPLCDKDKQLAYEVNELQNKNITDWKNDNQLVIYPCTNSGYGKSDSNKPCDESSPMTPITHYGITKTNAENYYLQKDGCISLRLATVFGSSPRMRTDLLVNNFVLKAKKDKMLALYEDSYMRNYIHIQDVTDAFLKVIEKFFVPKLDQNFLKVQRLLTFKENIVNEFFDGKNLDEQFYESIEDVPFDKLKFNYEINKENNELIFEAQEINDYNYDYTKVLELISMKSDFKNRLFKQVFNVGNDSINCSKMDLAKKISEKTPITITNLSNDFKDPDQRDYVVSSKKMEIILDFKPQYDLEYGIEELLKAYEMIEEPWYANY